MIALLSGCLSFRSWIPVFYMVSYRLGAELLHLYMVSYRLGADVQRFYVVSYGLGVE